MDWNVLRSLLDWLAPAGWLMTVLAWWRDRTVHGVRTVKETESTYQTLYNDISATVKDLSLRLKEVNNKVVVLDTALRFCQGCKYARRCPALKYVQGNKVRTAGVAAEYDRDSFGECRRMGPEEEDGSDSSPPDTAENKF